MTAQKAGTRSAGAGHLAWAVGLSGGLLGLLALLLVVSIATGGVQSVLGSLRSSSPPTPDAPGPAPQSLAQLGRACIAETKGHEAVAHFERDIPEGRWGDRVRGTASAASEPYVLWLFDAQCTPHPAVEVPARSSRTFTARVGQVWYYAEASAGRPVDGFACRVFSLSNSDATQQFSDTGKLIYHLD
ncbi:hypothetical protein [Micromonospora sp. NPDC049645]|uniref:hypothetical protein n=1 Tax=Micromonospora sp. NPDC049645 TaxID=3155508 RepID=UPI00342B2C5F